MFKVYTYFGRTVAIHRVPPNETHHKASENARKSLLRFEEETGQPAWVRYINN